MNIEHIEQKSQMRVAYGGKDKQGFSAHDLAPQDDLAPSFSRCVSVVKAVKSIKPCPSLALTEFKTERIV